MPEFRNNVIKTLVNEQNLKQLGFISNDGMKFDAFLSQLS